MCGVGLSRSANRSCGPGSQVPILENHVQLETAEAESKARLRKDMLHHSIHMLLFVWQSHHWNTANNGTKLSETLNYRYDDTAIENCDISHPVNDVNCRHPCISKGEKFDQANLPPHLTNFCAHLNQSHRRSVYTELYNGEMSIRIMTDGCCWCQQLAVPCSWSLSADSRACCLADVAGWLRGTFKSACGKLCMYLCLCRFCDMFWVVTWFPCQNAWHEWRVVRYMQATKQLYVQCGAADNKYIAMAS